MAVIINSRSMGKYFIPFCWCFAIPVLMMGQTYVGPVLGCEYSFIDPGAKIFDESEVGYYVLDIAETGKTRADHEVFAYTIGLQAEQYFGKRWYTSLSWLYSKKEFNHYTNGFSGTIISDQEYQKISYLFEINHLLYKGIGIGIGMGHNRLNQFKSNGILVGNNKREYGGLFSISYRYKAFSAELRYNHSWNLKEQWDDTLIFMRPTRSLSLSVSYLFQVLGPIKRNGKAMDCPTF